MDELVFCAAAIHGLAGSVSIASHATSRDCRTDDAGIAHDETEYRFDRGAIVRRPAGQDRAPSDLPCAECRIDRDVWRHPDGQPIDALPLPLDRLCIVRNTAFHDGTDARRRRLATLPYRLDGPRHQAPEQGDRRGWTPHAQRSSRTAAMRSRTRTSPMWR
ncbi:hypothetical protein [Burkholderia sp. MSMB1072]|uniref:hypothetical protein n=1 Tax=Burkholderia sp. MSMB1072 TaxID=1637871 RepID=UPI00211D3015|nr:hypothetical protein [Burkholderia sp. MSMB1072]